MRPIRVGLAGCGAMGRDVYLPLLRRLPEVRVVAVADPDRSALSAAIRQAPAAVACASHEELVARTDIEAVIVAAPTPAHAAIARLAFGRGLHVYLEKPLAATLAEAAGVLAAWRAAGTVGMIGFNYRFNPLYAGARRSLDERALGTVAVVRSVFATPGRGDAGWRRPGQPGGGALLDLASHHLDLLYFLFDRRITDIGRLDIATRADAVCVSGRLDGGVVFQSLFATGSVDEDRFDIYGDRGALSIDRYRSLDVRPRSPERRSRLTGIADLRSQAARLRYLLEKLRSPRREPSHARALRHFACAVRGHQRAAPDLVDGVRSLEAVLAAASPEAEGRQVEVASPGLVPEQEVQPR